jgi:hypothetical protein
MTNIKTPQSRHDTTSRRTCYNGHGEGCFARSNGNAGVHIDISLVRFRDRRWPALLGHCGCDLNGCASYLDRNPMGCG